METGNNRNKFKSAFVLRVRTDNERPCIVPGIYPHMRLQQLPERKQSGYFSCRTMKTRALSRCRELLDSIINSQTLSHVREVLTAVSHKQRREATRFVIGGHQDDRPRQQGGIINKSAVTS